jgi:hypothetical protein
MPPTNDLYHNSYSIYAPSNIVHQKNHPQPVTHTDSHRLHRWFHDPSWVFSLLATHPRTASSPSLFGAHHRYQHPGADPPLQRGGRGPAPNPWLFFPTRQTEQRQLPASWLSPLLLIALAPPPYASIPDASLLSWRQAPRSQATLASSADGQVTPHPYRPGRHPCLSHGRRPLFPLGRHLLPSPNPPWPSCHQPCGRQP